MPARNAFYAQSGGVTAVINATACGVIQTAAQHPEHIAKLYAGKNGILGALHEELIDVSQASPEAIEALRYTPAGAFGSCRHKLKEVDKQRDEYDRLLEVFKAHNIGYFFYNGGGDSQDTAHKISQFCESMGYPIQCIGIPKTVDNDLPFTDNCPGFGTVAKYVATSVREAAYDVSSMAASSTKVFVMEVMGRHAGWIAASTALAATFPGDAPHIILFPEIPLDQKAFLDRVKKTVEYRGYCVIVVSEGIQNGAGQFISETGTKDAFGHSQLGGAAPVIAQLIKQELGYKYHWAVPDYLQRASRHLGSKVDVEQAYALGKAAVEFAVAGKNAVLPIIVRESDSPYRWRIEEAPLEKVANIEKKLPREYISEDGFGITDACKRYLLPLIQGEDYPPYKDGLPDYQRFELPYAETKLEPWKKKT